MTIFENNEIKLDKFVSGSLSNNSYLISSKKDGNAIVIDVPDKPMELINKIPRNRLNKAENLEKIKVQFTMLQCLLTELTIEWQDILISVKWSIHLK